MLNIAGLGGVTMPAVPVFHVEQSVLCKADRGSWLYNIVLQNIFIWNHGTMNQITRFYAFICVPLDLEPCGTSGTTCQRLATMSSVWAWAQASCASR